MPPSVRSLLEKEKEESAGSKRRSGWLRVGELWHILPASFDRVYSLKAVDTIGLCSLQYNIKGKNACMSLPFILFHFLSLLSY